MKLKKWGYKNRFYLLAFAIPLLVLTIAYIAMGVWPFGERQVQIIDSYHQYAPFFSEFYRKVWSGESLLYSINGGLGMNFWAIVAYYLASPLNLLILLFPRNYVLEGFTFVLMLKIAFSGLTFSYYISKKFKRYDVSIVYFALFYALCGWMLGYNWNVMWMDCAALLPLIVLGVDRLIKEGKGLLYGITLGIAIFSNYYIAVMICMFLVLYFFVAFFENRRIYSKRANKMVKKTIGLFVHRGLLFAGYSLLAGAFGAVMILPTLSALSVSNSASSTFPTTIKFYNSWTEMIAQQFAFVKPTDLSGQPNLYFGVFTLGLVFLYIFRKGIPWSTKILKLLLLAFLVFSTNFRILDYIWHGFHFPNSLPARFTFIYAFLALSIAYESFMAIRKCAFWQLVLCMLAVPTALVVWCVLEKSAGHEFYTYLITGVFIDIYFILACVYKNAYRRLVTPVDETEVTELQDEALAEHDKLSESEEICRRRWSVKQLAWVILLAVALEAGGNGIYGLCENGTINRTSYNKYLNSSRELKELTDHLEQNGFYRMELDTFNGRNNNMWLDYPGVSLFASTMGADINDLMGKLGYFEATNKYSYVGATSLTDSILGVKFLVDTDELDSIRTFNHIYTVDKQHLYENPYALSLGFMVDESYADWEYDGATPQAVLNDFVCAATDVSGTLFTNVSMPQAIEENCTVVNDEANKYVWKKDAKSDDASVKFSLDITDGQNYYIYYQASTCDKLKVSRNDAVQSYSDTRGHFVELGNDGHIDLEFITDDEHTSGNIKIWLLTYDNAVFEAFYNEVKDQQLVIEDYSSTHVKSFIDVTESGLLFTSIPYDEGWTVKVDGQEVETKSVDGTLLYIELENGHHTIEMNYMPGGFIPGLILTLGSCLIFAVIIVVKSKKYCRRKKCLNK